MNKTLVWDLPVRVLHWAIALSITGALVLGLGVDDDSPWFAYHMLCGLWAGGSIFLRLIVGLIGSRNARFSSWPWSVPALGRYLRDVVAGRATAYAAHNPGSVWMAVVVFASVPLLIGTGLLGGGERFEEPHEVLAYVLLGAVVLHLLGLVLHTLRHRENIAWSMVNGRKVAPAASAIPHQGAWAGLAVAALVALMAIGLFRGYDPSTGRVHVPAIGLALTLNSEATAKPAGEHREERERHHHDHD
ncbi:cytochrome b/b6 domain-containing protein [Opitutus terrae]|uniref:Cytochrome B561 n=1 Tax=Opitutus terrae (strain DSM 11246 / JCM 15787 / PB90-1) TaxID=452637 RepID=B1ZS15_OPITP|nr:cytochrome b/b6 domain-containing protein [Opitutus terrae]ACB74691.1 cytochrome B561 [Opitutus terrae PB90-1]